MANEGVVYFLLRPDGLLKVGHTTNLKSRLTAHGLKKEHLIGIMPGDLAHERHCHSVLGKYRVLSSQGKWVELFDVPSSVIEKIRDQTKEHPIPDMRSPLQRGDPDAVRNHNERKAMVAELRKARTKRIATRAKTLSLKTTTDTMHKLRSLAAMEGMSMTAILERAVANYAQSITRTEAA